MTTSSTVQMAAGHMLRQRTLRAARHTRQTGKHFAGETAGQVTDLAGSPPSSRRSVFPRRRAVRRAVCVPLTIVVCEAIRIARLFAGGRLRLTRARHFSVSSRSREVPPQFVRSTARTVARRIALDAPTLFKRPRINGIEAELIEQTGHGRLGVTIIAGNDQRAPIR